jgi:hypothetical protein
MNVSRRYSKTFYSSKDPYMVGWLIISEIYPPHSLSQIQAMSLTPVLL